METGITWRLRRRLRRWAHRGLATARGWTGSPVTLLGAEIEVPSGVPHPGHDPVGVFFHRTVGPMVAPGQRVLVLGSGAGLGAVLAASRGAKVVALDADPRAVEATAANAAHGGLLAGGAEPGEGEVVARRWMPQGLEALAEFALVLWTPQDPLNDLEQAACVLGAAPLLLGEKGRMLLPVERGSGLEEGVASLLPDGYRIVTLARDLGLRETYKVLCVGWDAEAARARRHAARGRALGAKADKSRRRWEGKEPSE